MPRHREQFEALAVAINTGTNIPSVATPNGQAAFLFLLTSALAPLIRLGYVRMVWMALPYFAGHDERGSCGRGLAPVTRTPVSPVTRLSISNVRMWHSFADPHAQSEHRLAATKRMQLNLPQLQDRQSIGLGYVGLPLAVEFGKRFQTVGFDIKPGRIAELQERPRHARSRSTREELRGGEAAHASPPDLKDLADCQRLHRHRADADRRVQAAGPDAARAARARRSARC